MALGKAFLPVRAHAASAGARLNTAWRVASASLSTFFLGTWSSRRAIFEMVPRDMRTADPTRAAEFVDGYFAFGDTSIELDGRDLFAVPAPSDVFASRLHSFAWLRHMRSAQSPLQGPDAAALSRKFVLDWIARKSTHPRQAFTPQCAARRALSFTNHAAFLLDEADPSDYRAIMDTILDDVRFAHTRRTLVDDPAERCAIAIACAAVTHALIEHKALKRKTRAALESALKETFYLDGGTITRRAADLPNLLAEMLALKALLEARGLTVPQRLAQTCQNAMRMLRMIRHKDGSLARFQGTADLTVLAPDLVAAVTAYDTERGLLPILARESGYARLEADQSVVLFDLGDVPPLKAARNAHASCLSFEWSYGITKIITNDPDPGIRANVHAIDRRRTSAHSTLSVEGVSSALFSSDQAQSPLLSSGLSVVYDRDEDASDRALLARHTGYRRRFGLDHERYISVSENGRVLEGRDRLLLKSGVLAKTVRSPYAVHFHLQSGITVQQDGAQRCKLRVAGHHITFEIDGGTLELEDWVDRPGYRGPARAKQLVVTSTPAEVAELNWRFVVHDRAQDYHDEIRHDDASDRREPASDPQA